MSTWQNIQRWILNGLIAAILALVAIDAFMPLAPGLPRAIQPVMTATGLGQGQWNLFAPVPDSVNARLRAEIVYADGTAITWRSPEWSKLSAAERFVSNRRLEYFDSIGQHHNSLVWDDFARYLARTYRPADCTAKVRRVELWIEEALVLDPNKEGWLPWGYPEYGPPTLFYDRDFP